MAPISEKLNFNKGVTVADVLRHEAGFANFPNNLDSADVLLTENIKQNSVGKVRPTFCEVGNMDPSYILMTNLTMVLILLFQMFEDGPGPAFDLEGGREYHVVTRYITIIIISTITTNIFIIICLLGKQHCKTQGDAGKRGVQESPP